MQRFDGGRESIVCQQPWRLIKAVIRFDTKTEPYWNLGIYGGLVRNNFIEIKFGFSDGTNSFQKKNVDERLW